MISKLLMALVVLGTLASGVPDKDYFTAAVFESAYFHDFSSTNKDEIISANLNAYKKAVVTAASKEVDIIVFNEYGLFEYKANRTTLREFSEHVPDPKVLKANPCKERKDYQDRPILLTLSCLAKKHDMFIVANMVDKQPCEKSDRTTSCENKNENECDPCPENGKRIYNADVAFDREGNIVARYHKKHLYFELMNTPKPYDMATFDTDFGRFGLIVCFDSLWEEAIKLAKKHHIDTMIFPTYWFDDVVPLNAVEWQQSWALGNEVNFIAANTHVPQSGSLGSGIYSKTHGALVYTYSPDRKSRLLVARVPRTDAHLASKDDVHRFVLTNDEVREEKHEDGQSFPEYGSITHLESVEKFLAMHGGSDYQRFKEQFEQYALVKLTEPQGTINSCHAGTCCTINYSAEKMDEDYYLAVFNGTNNVFRYFKWAEEDCFLIRCDPVDGRPCVTLPAKANTVFDYVEIRSTFTASAHVYPTVSKQWHRLAPKSHYEIVKDGSETVLRYMTESNTPLLKAGMMARVYERDPTFVPYYPYY